MFRTGHVYLVTNLCNGTQYVGQTLTGVCERWKRHCHSALRGCGYLARAVKKYGKENFKVEVLLCCTEPLLDYAERHYIAEYKTLAPVGYNLTSGGDYGGSMSNATRKKMRTSAKRVKHTPEWNANVGQARLGMRFSDSHREALRLAWKAHKHKLSVEAVERIRQANTGRRHTAEAKAKMAGKLKGFKHTAQTRENMRQAQLRRPSTTDETRRRMSEAQKSRYV